MFWVLWGGGGEELLLWQDVGVHWDSTLSRYMLRYIYAWVFFHDLPQPPPMCSFHSLIKRICFVPYSFFHPSFPIISSPFLSPLLLWRCLFLLTVSNRECKLMLFWRSGLLLASSDFGVTENSKKELWSAFTFKWNAYFNMISVHGWEKRCFKRSMFVGNSFSLSFTLISCLILFPQSVRVNRQGQVAFPRC